MDELNGKVAVVTGAASGIGRALSLAFAREGMDVSLADIEADPLEETASLVRALGVRALTSLTDVRDAAAVEALAEATVSELGGLHVACNNAGVSGGGLSWEVDLATWNWVLGVNLFGVIHGMRSFVPRIVASGGGHLVNTASMAGLTSPAFMSPYNVSKHAVVTLSESLFQELAMTHPEVGVSVLCPGWVRTRIHEADRNQPPEVAQAAGSADIDPAMRELIAGVIAGGLDPDDVASQVVHAVRTRQMYVLTHADWSPMITDRTSRIVSGEDPNIAMLPAD